MEQPPDADLRRLADALRDGLEEMTEEALARFRVAIPEWTTDRPELDEVLRSGSRASIGAELEAFRDGAVLPTELPAIDAEGARLSARGGVPLDVHLFLYRVGHAVQWKAWFGLVEDGGFEPERRRALLDHGSRFFFDYADRLSRLATAEHQGERDRLLRGHEQRRVHLVRELLDGQDVDAAALDYPLDGHHLAAVASGDGAPDAVRALAGLLDRRLLLVELLQETWWAWLGGHRPADQRLAQALRRLECPAGVRLAVGDEGVGVEGFRRSHRQAAQAHQVASAGHVAAVLFEDVALEALAGHDLGDARIFVERELRGIEGEDARAVRLRETLTAYFAHGQNAAATAAALDLHEQTVAKRLKAIERRTGRSVTARRAELEVALRLRHMLAAQSGALSSDSQR